MTCADAFSAEPASKGGSGSYSMLSCTAWRPRRPPTARRARAPCRCPRRPRRAVMTLPSSTTRSEVGSAPSSASRSSANQWVAARTPLRRPADARIREPVHTEVVQREWLGPHAASRATPRPLWRPGRPFRRGRRRRPAAGSRRGCTRARRVKAPGSRLRPASVTTKRTRASGNGHSTSQGQRSGPLAEAHPSSERDVRELDVDAAPRSNGRRTQLS